jgi:hypothetical protein
MIIQALLSIKLFFSLLPASGLLRDSFAPSPSFSGLDPKQVGKRYEEVLTVPIKYPPKKLFKVIL